MEHIDWKQLQAEAEKADILPPQGETLLRCKEATWETASNSGKPMIRAIYETRDRQEIWFWQVLSRESISAVRVFLKYLGAHNIDPAAYHTQDQITLAMANRTVTATVTHEMYNGEKRAKLSYFRPAGTAGVAAPRENPEVPQTGLTPARSPKPFETPPSYEPWPPAEQTSPSAQFFEQQ